MKQPQTSRRSFLALAALTPFAVAATTACGASGPGAPSAGGGAGMWYLSGAVEASAANSSQWQKVKAYDNRTRNGHDTTNHSFYRPVGRPAL
jgi:hypothetical protein